MKKLVLIAAALATSAVVAPSVASADPGQRTETRTTVTKTSYHNRGYNQRSRWTYKTVCTTKWRHGRKYRQCHKVRVRR